MRKLINHRVVRVPQEERLERLKNDIVLMVSELEADERLVVIVPDVLGEWDEHEPLVLAPCMQELFKEWLREHAERIRGPVYNLPRLTAGFAWLWVKEDYDPRVESPHASEPREIRGALSSLSRYLDRCELKAA